MVLLTSCEADNFFPQLQLRGSKAGQLFCLNKQIVSSGISKDCTITTETRSNRLKLTQVTFYRLRWARIFLLTSENSGLFKGFSSSCAVSVWVNKATTFSRMLLQLRLSGISLDCKYCTLVSDSRLWENRTRTILHKHFLKFIYFCALG